MGRQPRHPRGDRTGPTPLGAGLWAGLHAAGLVILFALATGRVGAVAQDQPVAPQTGMEAFAAHCFSPFMTAERASERLESDGVRVDFYDLTPFSASNAPSPAMGRPVTPGTDRRCEVAFDGNHIADGIATVVDALAAEGILTEAEVPAEFAALSHAEFIAARRLNPRRIAVVQVGVRQGPIGPETFINVERLVPAGVE